MPNFFSFVTEHWQFCVLHFLEFGIWGAWIVVLANVLNARGFSRTDIGRIYATVPIGTMLASLLIGALVDRFLNTEIVLGVSHLIGAGLLFAMSRSVHPRPFYWLTLAYAIAFAPTLGLVNSIVFSHDADLFGGTAEQGFPWIRVFGTIGWIIAGLAHAVIVKKGKTMTNEPLLLASGLSLILGCYCFTLPSTPPTVDENAGGILESMVGLFDDMLQMILSNPVFFLVTLVAAMAMGLYFAFAALFLEKTGVPSRTVGPVMTIGQWIEIFFMLSLPWFLGTDNRNINLVLMVGIAAWALRFGLFAIGRPLPLVLFGIAIHGICFDFFFAAGMINANRIAPEDLKATAQSVYGFLVYGLGMYLGSEGSGWLNSFYTRPATATAPDAVLADQPNDSESPYQPPRDVTTQPSVPVETTDWRMFWGISCAIVSVAAVLFAVFCMY